MSKKACIALVIISLFLLSLIFSFQLNYADSQNAMATPEVEWTQLLPGISGTALVQTPDGGYLALGTNATFQNTDSGPAFANQTSIIVRTDSAGKVLWTKTLQLNGTYPEAGSLIATSDGGYAIVAQGSVNKQPAAYLIKTDTQANVQWSQLFPSYPSPTY